MFSFFKKPTKDLSKCKFDYEAYWKDIDNGISIDNQLKKMENLDYWVPVKDGESIWTFL
jgi:hypothetical protein